MTIHKQIKRAAHLPPDELARVFGISYDEAVLLKSQAEEKRTQTRNKKRRGPVDNTDAGTKATRKHRRSCPVFSLMARNKIDTGEYACAAQIERGYALVAGEVKVRQFRYQEPIGFTVSAESHGLRDAELIKNYQIWVHMLKERKIPFDFCRAVIIEGTPIREAERQFRMGNGKGTDLIIRALRTYAYFRVRLSEEDLEPTTEHNNDYGS